MTDPVVLVAAAFGCRAEGARRTAASFRPLTVPRGTVLFRQGETCHSCWLIVAGAAALRTIGRDGQLVQLASYGPGELAGVFPGPQTVEAELIADARLDALEVRAAALAQLACSEPDLGAGIASLIARQHQALLSQIANQMTLSATGRVYSELLALADAEGRIRPAPVLAAVAMRVNTTRETASRAVAAAERRGLLLRDVGELRIVSRARLESLVF